MAEETPHFDLDNNPHYQAADSCRALWAAVLDQYVVDLWRGVTRNDQSPEAQSALRDFNADQRSLRFVCGHLDFDAEAIAWSLMDRMTKPGVSSEIRRVL